MGFKARRKADPVLKAECAKCGEFKPVCCDDGCKTSRRGITTHERPRCCDCCETHRPKGRRKKKPEPPEPKLWIGFCDLCEMYRPHAVTVAETSRDAYDQLSLEMTMHSVAAHNGTIGSFRVAELVRRGALLTKGELK